MVKLPSGWAAALRAPSTDRHTAHRTIAAALIIYEAPFRVSALTGEQVVWIGVPRMFFMEPLDLSTKPPRSCREKLEGLMLMPRTIDKLRAQLPGGDTGGYIINGKIRGLSGFLLARLGISEDELRDAVAHASSEYG